MASRTLSDVLKDLKKENLIHCESSPEIPPWVEYSLSENKKQLCEAVLPYSSGLRNGILLIRTGARDHVMRMD